MPCQVVLAAARDCVGPCCKACPVCKGRACGKATLKDIDRSKIWQA